MIVTVQECAIYAASETVSASGAAPALGQAFARAWHERTADAERRLCKAISDFVEGLRALDLPPEEIVVAFKDAIRHFGGVQEYPTLLIDAGADGEECHHAYARAFACFIDAYYGETPR